MANEVSIYQPRKMGRVVRSLPPVRTFFRSTFFKNVETFNTKSVDVDFVKGSRKVAPFVHRMIGGKTVPNTGYQTRTYTPPLVAPDKVTTTDDLLARLPGEDLVSGMSPAERAVLKLQADFAELRDMIVRREELMCTQSIFNGAIPVIGDGLNELIDFGFTNKEAITTATKKWSNAASDPIGDLKRWHKKVQQTGFTNNTEHDTAKERSRRNGSYCYFRGIRGYISSSNSSGKRLPGVGTFLYTAFSTTSLSISFLASADGSV